MFQPRSSDFGSSVSAIQDHLGAVEKELGKIGRIAGRRSTAAAAAASDQIGEAISTIVSDMVERFRQSRQVAGDQATRLGNQALDLGASYGNRALRQVAAEVEGRPLIAIGVALGIGVLIGAAVLGGASASRRNTGASRRHR